MRIPAPANRRSRIAILIAVTSVTLGIHYGWLIDPFFGHVHWLHAAHGRFCYIPIVIAAAWFGLRGGVWQAVVISLLVLPYIFGSQQETHDLDVSILGRERQRGRAKSAARVDRDTALYQTPDLVELARARGEAQISVRVGARR